MLNCLFVGIGGFFGSILRYLMSLIPIKNHTIFPVNTLLVNIIGAFLIGLLAGLFVKYGTIDEKWQLMLKVGLCGGFTTFSTFSNESVELMKSGNWGLAALYIIASVVVCIVAAFCGQLAVKQ